MKCSLTIALMFVLLFSLAGCFIIPEESIPEPVLFESVYVYGLAWDDNSACCYIENDGDVVVDYKLTFIVDLYGHVDLILVVEKEGLEPGDIKKECVKIYCPVCEESFAGKVLGVEVIYDL